MSIDATRWAWTAHVKTSTQRLVLLSLADRAGEEHTAWPSIERLATDTVLDKKTVQKVILELIRLGLVQDTGERTGPTKRVRILKLVGVIGRHESPTKLDSSSQSKITEQPDNKPKIGNIKQSQKRNDSKSGNIPNFGVLNDPKNGILNDPKIGMQNLSMNLPTNLSQEHDWVPNQNQLITKIKMAGHERNLQLILTLPSFEFELSSFNAYFEAQAMSDSKKLHKFTAWIIDKFERYKKANPEYINQTANDSTTPIQQPVLNLENRKPKSLLGNIQ